MSEKIKHPDLLEGSKPLIQCNTVCRNNINHPGAPMTLDVALVPTEKLTIDGMANAIQHSTGQNAADVLAVWYSIERLAMQAIARGQRVELGKLGYLSVNVRTKTPKKAGDTIRADEVEVGNMRFVANKELNTLLQQARFKVNNNRIPPQDSFDIADTLESWFLSHEVITVKEFAGITHYSVSAARRLINKYVEEGYLEKVTLAKQVFVYRPTKGNFGK